MLIYANGFWVPAEEATVPFNDQGFLYGDSLFETIRVNEGQPFRVEKHQQRMQSGMDTIRLNGERLLEAIPNLLQTFIKKNEVHSALVKVMVTRGVLDPSQDPASEKPAIYMTSRPIPTASEWPVQIVFLEEKNYPLLRFYPAIKSGNYLGNMLAKKDATALGAFEPVFVNREGYITECAIRNIFFVKDNVLHTPNVKLGVLPGVIRDAIMELARKRGMQVEESFILKKDVHTMDEAFISSTGVGVLPVTWDGFESAYPHSRQLRSDLEQLFKSGDSNVT